MGIFTGNSTGKAGGLFFPQGFANGGPIQRLSPPSTLNVRHEKALYGARIGFWVVCV